MTAAAVALNRLGDEVTRRTGDRGDAGARRDLDPGIRADRPPQPALGDDHADRLDQATGLVFFPGTMVGMLLAGRVPPTPCASS